MTSRKLLADRTRRPRFSGGDNWGDRLRIGFLIDWLDSRAGEADEDDRALRAQAARGNVIALAAAHLSGRMPAPPTAGELSFTGHNDHWLEYGAGYHAAIAGHLHLDELDDAYQLYRRLLEVDSSCLSALSNLAECERRRGDSAQARALLELGERAARVTAPRHGVASATWSAHLLCAVARLEARADPLSDELLALAEQRDLAALVARLRAPGDQDRPAPAAHAAFGRAGRDQRIMLRAALRLAPLHPQPPPAAHGSFDELDEAEALIAPRR